MSDHRNGDPWRRSCFREQRYRVPRNSSIDKIGSLALAGNDRTGLTAEKCDFYHARETIEINKCT